MKKRTKRKKPARQKECTYVIEIEDWSLSYSLSLDRHGKISIGPYWEHTSLEMKGRFLYPETLAKQVQVIILGDREKISALEKPEDYRYEPKAVGGLTIRGKESEFLGSVPFDAIQVLCLLLQTMKLKYLILSGQVLYRGSADIFSMHFQELFSSKDIE
jgi:hypothetical protein